MRISDWSSDVCSSDLRDECVLRAEFGNRFAERRAVDVGDHRDVITAIVPPERIDEQVGAKRRAADAAMEQENGSASCRERVCQSVKISSVGGSLKKKNQKKHDTTKPKTNIRKS